MPPMLHKLLSQGKLPELVLPGAALARPAPPRVARETVKIVTSSGKTLAARNHNENGSKAQTSAPSARSAKASGAVFDRWLERKLHELFDAVAQEPIPDDLINLIITLERRDKDQS